MWADLVAWFQSPGGARVLQTAIVPAVAILVAGVVAALIARAAVRAVLARADREQAAAAVAALVEAARSTADDDGSRSGRRRTARLRAEADVRLRLLPLRGAAEAADWAAGRIDALQRGDAPADGGVQEVRGRLVEWVRRPERAKRLFPTRTDAVPAPAAPEQPARDEAPRAEPVRPAAAAVATSARASAPSGPAAAPGGATAAEPDAEQARRPAADAPAPDAEPRQPEPAQEEVPAWRRTAVVERLRQERARAQAGAGEDDEAMRTAPARLRHPHRAPGLPSTDADESVRDEVHAEHLHARHSSDDVATEQEAPAQASGQQRRSPAWLDDEYDDDAQVTRQDMDLRTPPPVAATSVRDRGATGEDIVPRS